MRLPGVDDNAGEFVDVALGDVKGLRRRPKAEKVLTSTCSVEVRTQTMVGVGGSWSVGCPLFVLVLRAKKPINGQ